jgi:hypothetical protein
LANGQRTHAERYTFTSIGKRKIKKIVEFVPIGIPDLVNLEFGDLQPDGSINDTVHSAERTKLYSRIMKTYYPVFSKDFLISAIAKFKNTNRRISFDPKSNLEYLAFIIKRF